MINSSLDKIETGEYWAGTVSTSWIGQAGFLSLGVQTIHRDGRRPEKRTRSSIAEAQRNIHQGPRQRPELPVAQL